MWTTCILFLSLSQIHDLKFQFPFYGHTIDSLAVTTGGSIYNVQYIYFIYMYIHTYILYIHVHVHVTTCIHTCNYCTASFTGFLYTGDLLHDRVHLTQFIAPLQADFNPNVTDNGRVLVLNTGEWN